MADGSLPKQTVCYWTALLIHLERFPGETRSISIAELVSGRLN